MRTFCGLTTDGMLDYLAAIYRLNDQHEKITTGLLAEQMHVSPAAASSMLRRLEEANLIQRSNADGILLTEQGRLAALQLIRRHRLLEVFLIQVMGFTWDQVDAEAHRMEHAISSAFEDRMDALCGYPTRCPHGDPIPAKDGTLPPDPSVPLLSLTPGQTGILRRVTARDPRALRYLARLALTPGRRVRLVDVAPFNGPVTLEILDNDNGQSPQDPVILGQELAAHLYVEVPTALTDTHPAQADHSLDPAPVSTSATR